MQHIFKFLLQFKYGLNALAKSIRDDMTVKVLICTNELLNLGKRNHVCFSPHVPLPKKPTYMASTRKN